MIETEKVGDIDWVLFTSNFVKLEEGEPLDLEVTNWRQTEEDFNGEKIDGIRFDVLGENGLRLEKTWVITSKRLATTLKPHIINADKMGRKTFKVRVLKSGKGFSTQYSVRALD